MYVKITCSLLFLVVFKHLHQTNGVLNLASTQSSYAAVSKTIRELEVFNQRLILSQEYTTQSLNNTEKDHGEWVVQIDGGLDEARWVASLTGSRLLGKMKAFEHMYIMQNCKMASPDSGTVFSTLNRPKRGVREKEFPDLLRGMKQVTFLEHQKNLLRQKRDAFKMTSKVSKSSPTFNDPLFDKQWQLHEIYLNTAEEFSFVPIRADHQISDAWQLGYTGNGVIVTIIDDGIDYRHGDLADNYDPKASYDFNDNDPDPMPTMDETNSHGTKCAGEVAMTANNFKCGVGVAYNAKIGGIRILDGNLNDRMEAEAFTFGLGHIDIMSISWGPKDDGKTAEKPGRLSQMALEKGVNEGRNGIGTIYVWASGNGGLVSDDCATDGYASNVHSFTVSGVASDGSVPWYAEQCSNTLVSAYSTGYWTHKSVVTTSLGNTCTKNHTGTSAATPIAVGIIALGLEANPQLTWRDVQHIAIWTADPSPTFAKTKNDWRMNSAGFLFHAKIGFGLMNALEFVKTAKEWKSVPQQRVCVTEYANFITKSFTNSTSGHIKFETGGCRGEHNEVRFIERVQIILDIEADFRGHISLWLQSPEGTCSQLLSPRPLDVTNKGFEKWPFTTVHMWGENPSGAWTLQVKNTNLWTELESNIHIKTIKFVVFGTKRAPLHYMKPRNYKATINLQEKAQLSSKARLAKEGNLEDIIKHLSTLKKLLA